MALPQTPQQWAMLERYMRVWMERYPQSSARPARTDDMRAMIDDLERTGQKAAAGSVRGGFDFAPLPSFISFGIYGRRFGHIRPPMKNDDHKLIIDWFRQ